MFGGDKKIMKILDAPFSQEATVYIFIIIISHFLAFSFPYFKKVIFA